MAGRVIETKFTEEEKKIESGLRPLTFSDYIGQEKMKEALDLSIKACKLRGDVLDHMLFYGPPGLGKTTISNIIASEMGVNIRITSGPAIDRAGDMASILTSLHEGDILFIDEIHRLNKSVEEVLYPAMEDFCIDIMIGNGPSGSKSVHLKLPKFTLIGATTRAGMLSSPFRDRFGIQHRLEFYNLQELSEIIKKSANRLNVKIEDQGALELSKRSRGTPRIANRLLKRVRDYALVRYDGVITKEIAVEALNMLGVDDNGLDELDKTYLSTIIKMFKGGPVGLDTLAAAISEDPGTIEDVYEPYLIKNGFIMRTPKGRVVTEHGYECLGIEFV